MKSCMIALMRHFLALIHKLGFPDHYLEILLSSASDLRTNLDALAAICAYAGSRRGAHGTISGKARRCRPRVS